MPEFRPDFNEILLHELGHVLGMDHVIDNKELMRPTNNYPQGAASYERMSIESGSSDALLGVNYIFDNSRQTTWQGCTDVLTFSDSKSLFCGVVTSNEYYDLHKELNVYPIPVKNEGFTVSYTLNEPAEVSFSIIDVTGKEVKRVSPSNKSKGDYQDWISSEDLSKGVYMLLVNIDGETKSLKIVK